VFLKLAGVWNGLCATAALWPKVHYYSRMLLAPAFISALLAWPDPHPNQDVTLQDMHTAFQMHHTSRALNVCTQHSRVPGGTANEHRDRDGKREHPFPGTGCVLREVGEAELVPEFGYSRRLRKQNIIICRIWETLWLAVYRQSVRLGDKPLETQCQKFYFPTENLRL
jgi:hypothetical protein